MNSCRAWRRIIKLTWTFAFTIALLEITSSTLQENDSTCTLDSGLSDSSPIPYYIWSTWTPEEVVNWATSQATLIQWVLTWNRSCSYTYSTLCVFVFFPYLWRWLYLEFSFVCRYVKPVFNWFGIDGKYLQLLMSRDNDFFWRETRLSEEQKVYNSMSLCSTASSIICRLAFSKLDVHL